MFKTSKNILFTLWYAHGYHGGVMYVAEIGEYLSSKGWNVSCAALELTDEIKSFWKSKGINAYQIHELPVNEIHYDIVWYLHYPLLPFLILRGLKYSKIIYNSLSAFLDLETPVGFASEFNLNIAVSKECKDSLVKKTRLREDEIIILNNLVPTEFFNIDRKKSNKISKIAVVSNHVPQEVLDCVPILGSKNIKVDIYGEKHNYVPVTPELLSNYDVIITIGKTVQYSLALEIPCYNYDHFGGSGYITLENIDKEEEFNFSGRSFKTKKSAQVIVDEILSQYSNVMTQVTPLKQLAMERYLLPLKINEIVDMLEVSPTVNIDIEKHYLTLIQHNFIVTQMIQKNRQMKNLKNRTTVLKDNVNLLKNKENICFNYYRYKFINIILFGKNKHYYNKYNEYKAYIRKIRNIINTKQKLTAIMCVKNEEYYLPGFLKHIEKYVDAIVAVDDGSTDNTVAILENHPKCKKVLKLPYHESEDWDEVGNRKLVIGLAKSIGSDWVLCCDADERFEEGFLKNIRKLIKSNKRVCYHVKFREMWDNYKTYRNDGIWDKKEKGILFPLLENMNFCIEQSHHIPWCPKEIRKHKYLDYNLYHFKMLKKEDREARRDLYNKIDPNKVMQKVGYDYLVDTSGIKLKRIPLFKKYLYDTIPQDLKNYKVK